MDRVKGDREKGEKGRDKGEKEEKKGKSGGRKEKGKERRDGERREGKGERRKGKNGERYPPVRPLNNVLCRQNLTRVAHIIADNYKNRRRKINKNHTFYHIYFRNLWPHFYNMNKQINQSINQLIIINNSISASNLN